MCILTLAERLVASLMTPRNQISWIDIGETPDKIREQVLSVPHSLFPVYPGRQEISYECDSCERNIRGSGR